MSLLMDALRKAEQEKLKAAKARDTEEPSADEAATEIAEREAATRLMPDFGDETIAQPFPAPGAAAESSVPLELEARPEDDTDDAFLDLSGSTEAADVETDAILRGAQTDFPEPPADDSDARTLPTPEAPSEFGEDEELSMEMTIPSRRAVGSALRDYFSNTGTFSTNAASELDDEERYTRPAQKFLDGTLPSMRAVQQGLDELSSTGEHSVTKPGTDLGATLPSRRSAATSVQDFFDPTQTGSLSSTGPTGPSTRNLAASRGNLLDSTSPSERQDLGATAPSKRSLQSSMNDFFDGTLATGERPVFTETGEGARLSAEMETGLKDSTQVNAYTVFAASQDSRSRQVWEWGLAAVGLVALLLGAGVLYQYFTAPKTSPANLPAASVPPHPDALATAKGSDPSQPKPPPGTPAASAGPREAAPPDTGTAAVKPGSGSPTVAKSEPVGGQAPAGQLAKSAPAAKLPGATGPAAQVPAGSGQAGALRGAAPGTEWGSMSIERGVGGNEQPVANALQDAYQAFRAGSITRAEEVYRSVLRLNPDQRDALLGMAAIASKRGEKETAIGHYRHLLEIDPKDSIANAALYSLQGPEPGGGNSEERLRRLAEQDPNSAHLQFTLGNVYAQQGRWGDAQNAYFRALSVDKNNADYAYNLAVSLDRLGQGKTAVQYYQRALELGRQQTRRFNDMEVTARIQTLSGQRASSN